MNTFEQSLLTELREQVAARGTTRPRSRRWRWAAIPVAAVAAGAAVVAMQPNPAYAVSGSGDDIVITIHRLDDADGLERALAEHGIEAEVDYSPTDTVSADPAEESAEGLSVGSDDPGSPADAWGTVDDDGTVTRHEGEPSLGDVLDDLRFESTTDGSLTLTIDRESIPAGEVLQIVTSGSAEEGLGLAVGWAPAD